MISDYSTFPTKNLQTAGRVRVATYNTHKCRGIDGRIRPERIVEVLREIDADIVALQEVCCREGERPEDNQARYIAEELGLNAELGETRRYRGGAYGNLLLSRLPIHHARNHDLSVRGRERRGCLRTDIRLADDSVLHLFNVHLGTALFERRIQTRELSRRQIFTDPELGGRRIILGDFNEWIKDLPSEYLAEHFESANSRMQDPRTRTFPGLLPFLALDFIYFDRSMQLEDVMVHRSPMALRASDHLPLVAEFALPTHAPSDRRAGQAASPFQYN
ncbi:MAG TPA: endonuclease/exonuclease/phosphatase family protein [Terracidiphilus sp.]|nr:endonuclease/exonuclease/phosphatase family protein [Terracidiphilus sp.]